MGEELTGSPPAIHGILNRVGVRPLALAGQLLLTIHALPARDLEGRDHAVAFLELGDLITPFEDAATELVAKDVAFL